MGKDYGELWGRNSNVVDEAYRENYNKIDWGKKASSKEVNKDEEPKPETKEVC